MAVSRHGAAAAVVALASVIGVGIALYHYAAPMTGVTGTIGALSVIVSSLLVALAGLLLWFRHSGGLARAVRVAGWLLTLGTIAAGWLLHESWLVAAMIVALVAAMADFARAGSTP
jgi:quinoprotein glucose dehydrogenase